MADALTTTSTLGLDQVAFDLAAYPALREELFWDEVASVKPAPGNMPGTSTTFRKIGALAVATTPLSEAVDVNSVAMSDSTVSVALAEYGNAVVATALARNTAYIPLDPEMAREIGANAGESVDTVAGATMVAGTNVKYGTAGASTPTSRTTIAAEDLLSAHDVREAKADLDTANVPGLPSAAGAKYAAFIHPHVALDLKEETGAAAWVEPVNYSDAIRRWNGEIGTFEGFRFMPGQRSMLFADASNGAGAAGTIDVYRTVFVGGQALAKTWAPAVGPRPRIGLTPVTDHLERFRGVYWYWTGGYGIFRQESIRAVESTSSIGVNA